MEGGEWGMRVDGEVGREGGREGRKGWNEDRMRISGSRGRR